jgi:hypothetical protein
MNTPETWGKTTLHKWTCSGCLATCMSDIAERAVRAEVVIEQIRRARTGADIDAILAAYDAENVS